MKILITYDINRRHPEVKNALLKKGFKDFWETKEKTIHYLPNTTLWHPNLIEPAEAKKNFLQNN